MWWLCFERNGETTCVVIIAGECLLAARMRAAIAELGEPEDFTQGHRLDDRCAAALLPRDIGRELLAVDARAALRRIEGALRRQRRALGADAQRNPQWER